MFKGTRSRVVSTSSNFFAPKKPFVRQGPLKCSDCKYSILGPQGNSVCRLFLYGTIENNDREYFHFYMDTVDCRADKELCGPSAVHFKSKYQFTAEFE